MNSLLVLHRISLVLVEQSIVGTIPQGVKSFLDLAHPCVQFNNRDVSAFHDIQKPNWPVTISIWQQCWNRLIWTFQSGPGTRNKYLHSSILPIPQSTERVGKQKPLESYWSVETVHKVWEMKSFQRQRNRRFSTIVTSKVIRTLEKLLSVCLKRFYSVDTFFELLDLLNSTQPIFIT